MGAKRILMHLIWVLVVSFLAPNTVTQGGDAFGEEREAGALAAPVLSVLSSGNKALVSWTSVPGATGYLLHYAPYFTAGPRAVKTINMGVRTQGVFELHPGAAYYVAVQAKGAGDTSSPYSTVELVAMIRFPTPVPDTGQSECFGYNRMIRCPDTGRIFYGQDASYPTNPRIFRRLDVEGRTQLNAGNSWVMVEDMVTGLMWEVKTTDGSVHDRNNRYDWNEAKDLFLGKLNSSRFGGYSDWRLPTVRELACLVDYGAFSPAVDTGFFPNTQNARYWTATVCAYNPRNAQAVDFQYGYDSQWDQSSAYHVRAVRGGRLSNVFQKGENDTVIDINTGLMWQQATAPGKYDWQQALSYCENLRLAGYEDWRLPDIKELRSIVNDGVHEPAIDLDCFPGTAPSLYWSSTPNIYNATRAWGINFNHGYDYIALKTGAAKVRAVRGGR